MLSRNSRIALKPSGASPSYSRSSTPLDDRHPSSCEYSCPSVRTSSQNPTPLTAVLELSDEDVCEQPIVHLEEHEPPSPPPKRKKTSSRPVTFGQTVAPDTIKHGTHAATLWLQAQQKKYCEAQLAKRASKKRAMIDEAKERHQWSRYHRYVTQVAMERQYKPMTAPMFGEPDFLLSLPVCRPRLQSWMR